MSALDHQFLRGIRSRLDQIRSIEVASLIEPTERHRRSIEEVQLGGVICLRGKTYRVVETGRYDEYNGKHTKRQDFSSSELKLFCLEDGTTVYLEWERDDEVEVSLTKSEHRMSELRDDEGGDIDEDDIEAGERVLVLNGVSYNYDDDWAAKYHRNGEGQGEKVYFYDYESPNGRMLTIEEWQSGTQAEPEYDYQIFVSVPVHPQEIEVIAVGAV